VRRLELAQKLHTLIVLQCSYVEVVDFIPHTSRYNFWSQQWKNC